jgi:hypothetical protein
LYPDSYQGIALAMSNVLRNEMPPPGQDVEISAIPNDDSRGSTTKTASAPLSPHP